MKDTVLNFADAPLGFVEALFGRVPVEDLAGSEAHDLATANELRHGPKAASGPHREHPRLRSTL
jgi:hypothetical protein